MERAPSVINLSPEEGLQTDGECGVLSAADKEARQRAGAKALTSGLAGLFQKSVLVDVALQCAGKTFLAHKAVLAAQSAVFRKGVATPTPETALPQGEGASGDAAATPQAPAGGAAAPAKPSPRKEIKLEMVSNPEAVQLMLDLMYEGLDASSYNPATPEVNKDVLRLAHSFELPSLQECAAQYLARGIDTANVVERLAVCEEFGLDELRDGIAGELVTQAESFLEVASSTEIRSHPGLMRLLLQRGAADMAAKAVAEKEAAAQEAAKEAAKEAAAKEAAAQQAVMQAAMEAAAKEAQAKQAAAEQQAAAEAAARAAKAAAKASALEATQREKEAQAGPAKKKPKKGYN